MLITGAAGRVGGILRTEWADNYDLVLADIREPGSSTRPDGTAETRQMASEVLQPHERFVHCDTSDMGQMLAACQGCDVVVHLAADPNPGADWETSLLRAC